MDEHKEKFMPSAEAGLILNVYEHMKKGANQFVITRNANHLRFDARYDTHPILAKIKAGFLKDWGINFKIDEQSGWVYAEVDSTTESIDSVKSMNLPYLHLIDI